MSKMLSEREYIRFQKARQSSFICRTNASKFCQWVLGEDKHINDTELRPLPNPVAWEILQHLAYELVGTITDLVFQIRQQKKPIDEEPGHQIFLSETPLTATTPSEVKTCNMPTPFLIPQAQETISVKVSRVTSFF